MKLTGVRTVVHVENMNDVEKNFLQDNGGLTMKKYIKK